MKKTLLTPLISALMLILLSPLTSLAQPPQSAIDACQNKSIGDVVQFINHRGDTVTATCTLIAIPDEPQRRGKMGKGFRNKRGDRRDHRGMFANDIQQLLNLTDKQQAQIDKLRVAYHEDMQGQQDFRRAQRIEMKQVCAQTLDEAKLRKTLEKIQQARTDRIIERAKLRQQFFDILTPEQVQILAQHQLQQLLLPPDDKPDNRPGPHNFPAPREEGRNSPDGCQYGQDGLR